MWCAHWLWVPALRIWDLGFWGVQECATRQFSDDASGSEARMTLRRFQMGKLCSVNSRWTNLSWANFGWVNFRGKKKEVMWRFKFFLVCWSLAGKLLGGVSLGKVVAKAREIKTGVPG